MKSFPLRPLRALCAVTISVFLAACGGGGGSSTTDARACCYDYSTFVVPPSLVGPDPLLPDQWHLDNFGQSGGTAGEDLNVAGATGAWALGTKGEGVRVAIVDDAVETVHPDLAPNFSLADTASYYNYLFPGSPPLPYYLDEDHGTSVAGIAVARDGNAIGGAGVAPRASLGAYNALATSQDADIADALRRAPDVTGVYNNSWGSPDNGVLNAAEPSFVTAIEAGIKTGRNGKGSIYVFPAGNGGNGGANANVWDLAGNRIAENSNFDGYVNKRGVIAVCAVDDNGVAPSYAEPGANILVCGRSGNDRVGITTTMPQGAYRSTFSGTSASTPTVSGIVALMLKERPDLTWRDVRLILAKSARKNHPADPGWVYSPASGLSFNPRYGFGAVDAAAAVTMARTWTTIDGGSPVMKSCSYPRSGAPTFPISIPDNVSSPVSDTVTVDASSCTITRIEFVEVEFDAGRAPDPAVTYYSGDLRVELIGPAPASLLSLLASERQFLLDSHNVAHDSGSYSHWKFGSVRHLEESPAGTWTLRVTDAQPGDSGVWNSWRLTIWGR